jgi:hypothetical protein
VPERAQVTGGRAHPGRVVAGHEREVRALHLARDEDRRHAGVRQRAHRRAVARRGRDDQALAAARLQLGHRGGLAVEVVVGVGEQAGEPGLPQRLLDPAHDRREHRVGQVGDEHADDARTACAQAARGRVRRVAERARRRADAARGRLRDPAGERRVERPRRRGRVHSGPVGDVADGGAAVQVRAQ